MTDEGQPTVGRVERKRSRRINEILRVAADELATRGYHSTSLEDVADRLDLTKASLYYYFDSKEALVAACLSMVADETLERLVAVTRQELAPAELLTQLIETELTISVTEFPESSQLFLRQYDWPESIGQQVREWRVEHDHVFASVISRGVEQGVFSPVDATTARQCLYGALSYAPLWLRGVDEGERRAAFGSIATHMLAMFGTNVAPPSS